MSCNHCQAKFGFLRKEFGCANCGLSLCSKCVQQKRPIPSKGPGEYKVCRVCYGSLGKSPENPPVIPPDRFLKRLEQMETTAHPITVYRQKTEFTGIDREIADRLERLKQSHSSDKPNRCTDEFLARKLALLKGEEYKPNQIPQYEEMDSEEEVEQLTKKLISEVSLEEKCPIESSGKEEEEMDVPDLPWCVLCNNDATFKCLDCEDLYCTPCSREVHKQWGETDHKLIPFKPS